MKTTGIFDKPDGIYALSHSVGPLVKSASHALQTEYLTSWAKQGGDAWPHWLAQIDAFCEAIGEVLNAPARLICPQVNLASGFYGFLTAIAKLPSHKHQSTILMHKDAFASMGFVVTGLAKTFNLKLHLIEGDPNDIDAWYTAFENHQVLACLVTHVHSNTSVKSNVAEICNIAKQFEAFACVDIAQSAGVVPVDVIHWQADAVFGSCVKWLCGGPGAGFMYVKEILIATLEPDPIGWFSHQNPFEFDITHYVAADDAKRFWGGTPSIAPYVMATASIKTMLGLELPRVVTHNALMKEIMADTLPKHNTYAYIKEHHSRFGGSLCIPANDHTKTQAKLAEHSVKYDCRGNVFRLSLHVINTEEEAIIIGECFT
ncbi:MAG: selenocysteine lyase/cysteine desulfurase [Alphaproteobacteria bacterium]|jgi:selenocysteine lyase/cysteine desulfurase